MSSDLPRAFAQSVARDDFRRACGRFATGIAIAGALDPHGVPHGLTINSFTSVSLDPPLILICIAHSAASREIFSNAASFALSLLREDAQAVSERFARQTHHRFEGLAWQPGKNGAPLVSGALAEIECVVRRRIEAGDHDILLGEVTRADSHTGEPLVYFGGHYRHLTPPR
jgi:(E)-2-((N-methylformamido)methylene)succinate hydrolase